jgi:hypothetical protein
VRVVDAEKLVSFYLRDEGFRVVGSPPADRSSAWVRLQQIADTDLSRPQYLVQAQLQLDCYAGAAGGQPEAIGLALSVREALERLEGEGPHGVVTATQFRGQNRLPDPTFEPPRERVILQVLVTSHPAAVAA